MGRLEKVNQQLKREISQIIQQELADPRLSFVTITSVKVSADLRHARVYFSVLGDQKLLDELLTVLQKAKGTIRKYVGQRIRMRFTPDLAFHIDDSIELNQRIEETITALNKEHDEDNRPSPEEI